MAQASVLTLTEVINRVQKMPQEQKHIVEKEHCRIMKVMWEDNARNKNSAWGPCISDMTLQVGDARMPVIKESSNMKDITCDIEMNKIPIVVGNHNFISSEDEKAMENEKPQLKTINLKEYLQNFDQYTTRFTKNDNNDNNNNNVMSGLFGNNNNNKINLLRKDLDKDVIVSAQACFLPIEYSKETTFNVALYNYQSKKKNPAILAIVATSKGTSAQIIEGDDQKLLFNNNGKKADFIAQRLSDNRMERGIFDNLQAPMTNEEKQDNCILVIQVPLKQKEESVYRGLSLNSYDYGGAMSKGLPLKKKSKSKSMKRSMHSEPDVEDAIVKVAPKTVPTCICDANLEKLQLQFCYGNLNKPENEMTKISCDKCGTEISNKDDIVWHCKKDKNDYRHRSGYDLCMKCGQKQLEFDELNEMDKIERDERFPVRVTLQFYKSTTNGVINEEIMKGIAEQLKATQKGAKYIGSLVTDYNSNRTTEWVKGFLPFINDFGNNNNNNNNNNNGGKQYELIEDILGNLKLNEYYKEFVKHEITDARLILLEDKDLEKLFDKLGAQIVFRHWLRGYKNTALNKNNVNITEPGQNM